MRKNRKSKVTPCQVSRKKQNPKVVPGAEYNPEALHHAVERAARKAGVTPWHPNRLRHLRATEVRRLFGLEGAQVVLGHAKADVTQVYAERNDALAATVARQIG
jgi:integrase